MALNMQYYARFTHLWYTHCSIFLAQKTRVSGHDKPGFRV